MHLPSEIKRFLKDLSTPRLLVIKALYFSLLAGVVILWPQFTIHQQELGLTTYQTGVCSAAVAACSIIIPLLSGFLGDKLGNYKIVLSIITALVGVIAILFTFIPGARISPNTPINPPAANTRALDTSYTTSTTTSTTTTNSSYIEASTVDTDQLSRTFWIYLVVRVSYGGLQSVCYMLFESSVMAHTQKDGVDYGFQRAWGTLAVIISSYLSGHLVQLTGSFNVIFYVSGALQVVSAGLVLLLDLEFKLPAQRLTRDIVKQVWRAEVIMFFCAMLATGVFFGYLETFMYRYLSFLGAPPMLIGLTVTVGAPFELVLTLLTSCLVARAGHAPLIMFGLAAHAIRLFGFSMLVDPWWVLPLEVLESVANGVLATAAVMYCTVLFTMQSIASFRGIYAVLYFGIGQLMGTMVGAEVREVLGDVMTFRILAGVALFSSIAYAGAFYTMRRYKSGSVNPFTPPPITIDYEATKTVPEDYKSTKKTTRGIDNPAWCKAEI